jgi:hypothetical protein
MLNCNLRNMHKLGATQDQAVLHDDKPAQLHNPSAVPPPPPVVTLQSLYSGGSGLKYQVSISCIPSWISSMFFT